MILPTSPFVTRHRDTKRCLATRAFDRMTSQNSDAGTILVVDDEEPVRRVLVLTLRGEGYEVLEAPNGDEALAVAAKHAAPIDLVVSDVVMPRMGGSKLLETLRRWYPGLRFLLVSGYPDALGMMQGVAGARTAFLGKPFTHEQLVGAVRELIGD
jgi:CheY-like chemotaxis protein